MRCVGSCARRCARAGSRHASISERGARAARTHTHHTPRVSTIQAWTCVREPSWKSVHFFLGKYSFFFVFLSCENLHILPLLEGSRGVCYTRLTHTESSTALWQGCTLFWGCDIRSRIHRSQVMVMFNVTFLCLLHWYKPSTVSVFYKSKLPLEYFFCF